MGKLGAVADTRGFHYVRVGSINRRADSELIEDLRRFARRQGCDEQPMLGLDLEALDFQAASESFDPFRKLDRRDLETSRLSRRHQGRKVPIVGGMRPFGKARERHFPGAWIQAGRFVGTDKTHSLDHAEIPTIPVSAAEEAIALPQDPKRRYFRAERGTA